LLIFGDGVIDFGRLLEHFSDLLLFGLFTGLVRLQGSAEGNRHSIIEDFPTASLLQTPGARSDATAWCDESGHVWLFGGEGYDGDTSSVRPKFLNDLWMLNTSRLEWNVMHTGTIQSEYLTNNGENTKIVTGDRHQNNTSSIVPEPRKSAASCGVPGIVFVIFGGIDSNGSSLSNTWIYIIPKARWLLLSDSAHPPTVWSTKSRWCHLDGLYVIGSSIDNATEMWRFSLRTLKWSNETVYLTDEQQQHTSHSLLQPGSANSISVVWNGSLYLYQWQITHHDSNSNSLTFSVDLQWLQSLPSVGLMNNRHSTPVLWTDLNSFGSASITCSSSDIFHKTNNSDESGELCIFHGSYEIKSSILWPEQRLRTSSWFYEGKLYIFGGQDVVSDDSDLKTFFNDLCVLQQSFVNINPSYWYSMLLFSSVIVAVTVILIGFCAFFTLRYCDYRRGRNKSRELHVRYIPLRDLDVYEIE